METRIGRIEAHVEHIQFDVTDLRQDMKTVLRNIGRPARDERHETQPNAKPQAAMKVTLDAFPDLGLIVRATTNVIYSNQAGGVMCLHPELEGFFVPLCTHLGMRELQALQDVCGEGWNTAIDDEMADTLDWIFGCQGLRCIRVDRSKLEESWESWVHVTVSGELSHKVPLEEPRPETLRAVLTWPNRE